MPQLKKYLLSTLLCLILIYVFPTINPCYSKAASIEFVLLSQYKATLNIGEELYLIAITTNGAMPTWKSSSSTIVAVNTYGKMTAKKAGTATVTAKIKNGEASCRVTVSKTKLTISDSRISIERGGTYQLLAATSNSSTVIWKSSKKSVATIDENGVVTGIKPGESRITATADGTTKTCTVIIKSPTIKLNLSEVKLYRGQTAKLSATVSSNVNPTYKSNKSSVATVDETGMITAMKHGTAIITATVDGISRSCEVIVNSPTIELNESELQLVMGTSASLTAKVSSGNPVTWSTSNENVISVSADGTITAWQPGRAYLYASEDGTKVRCVVYVKE
ncbi:MAG: hypothetical protein K0R46_1101 [Herbinix sp.]|jgi:uncharacterized protein YjdB|nr:hypothetical protein [Herbinix sp.]